MEGEMNHSEELFKIVNVETLSENVFTLIDKDWMLITAGNGENLNTMTASWGGLGILWHRRVAFVFVRPSRYTYQFMEDEDLFSLSFFGGNFREALNLCGTVSGRDVDKVDKAGLTPARRENGGIYFQEASLVFICKKLYFDDLRPELFLDPAIEDNYPKKDYHRMYIGEIIEVLKK